MKKLLGGAAYPISSLANIKSGIKGSDFQHEYIVINFGPSSNQVDLEGNQ